MILRFARDLIECAFNCLKVRWSLSRTIVLEFTTFLNVVSVCFVAHNFCELHIDSIIVEHVRPQMEKTIIDENIQNSVYSSNK